MDPLHDAVLTVIFGLAVWGIKSRFEALDNLIQNHLMHRLDAIEERLDELIQELRK